ncbi:MAG TPA: FHA domain-containing protein, partial [Myxococcota bacterium]|nr:FHA domain-containing protein [Myxococcota bacterium]
MADDREPNPSDDSGIEATRVGQPAAADEEGGTSIIESPFDQGAPAPARLVIVSGPNAGLRRDLPDGPFVLGRGTDCDLVLDDPAVSRRHVRLFAVGRMRFAQDLGSGNG